MTHKLPYNVYIASCDQSGGIYHYRIDGQGVPQAVGFVPMDRPMYLTADGHTLHVLLRAPFDHDYSGWTTCEIDEEGILSDPTPIESTRGVVACHHAVVDGARYCVNYLSGNVVKMPDTVATHDGHSVHPTRQTAPHTHFVCAAPDGKYLLVTDLGTDRIFVYDRALHAVSTVEMPQGHGPRHLALHPNGHTVFCVNELASTVSVLEYADGRLTLLDTVSALPSDSTVKTIAAAIRFVDGRVYVSNRGHDSISVLRFDHNRLVFEKTLSTFGKSPRDFWIEGDLLIATNELSDNVTCLSLTDGRLLADIPVKSPICVLCRS